MSFTNLIKYYCANISTGIDLGRHYSVFCNVLHELSITQPQILPIEEERINEWRDIIQNDVLFAQQLKQDEDSQFLISANLSNNVLGLLECDPGDFRGVSQIIEIDQNFHQIHNLIFQPKEIIDERYKYNLLVEEHISQWSSYDTNGILNLSHFGLTELPLTISCLKGVRELNCDFNRISFLHVERLPVGLECLYCSNNCIEEIIGVIPNTLHKFYCNSNRLRSLPVPLPSHLHYLECNDNLLTELPEYLGSELSILDCANNQLRYLPVILPKTLHFLDCHDNKISVLSEIFLCKEMTNLNCSNNKLVTLPSLLPETILKCDFYDAFDKRVFKFARDWCFTSLYMVKKIVESQLNQEKKERIESIKEELMMKAWAPHRIERWLSQGLSLEEILE